MAEQLRDKAVVSEKTVTVIKYDTICLMLQYFLGKAHPKEIYDKLMEYETDFPHKRVITWEDYNDKIIDSFNLILKSLCILVKDYPDCTIGIEKIFNQLLDIYIHFPSNNYMECVANGFIYLYLIPALQYLEKGKVLLSLLHLTVYRQPQTMFHTVMVVLCAKLVMKELIHQRPESLVHVCGCQNVEEVVKNEEDLTRREQEIPHFYKWWDELR